MSFDSEVSNSIMRDLGPDEEGNPAYTRYHFPSTPVIKWYQVKMSYEEKARFNLLTYPEYCQWMQEIMDEAKAKEAEANPPKTIEELRPEWDLETTTTTSANTFWKNDDGKRQNMSKDEYQQFLSENAVNVANKTLLDISDLLQEIDEYTEERDAKEAADAKEESGPPPVENNSLLPEDDPAIQEVLRNVNNDIHGESYLTQEEIEALFAAANAAGG